MVKFEKISCVHWHTRTYVHPAIAAQYCTNIVEVLLLMDLCFLQVYHLTLQLKEWLAEKLVQFWGDLSSLEYPTRSKVRKVAAEGYLHGSNDDLTNNVHAASTDDSVATSPIAHEHRPPEEDNQPVSYRLRRRQVSENRHTEGTFSPQGSSEEQPQLTVLTRHGRKVKPTQRFSPLVK